LLDLRNDCTISVTIRRHNRHLLKVTSIQEEIKNTKYFNMYMYTSFGTVRSIPKSKWMATELEGEYNYCKSFSYYQILRLSNKTHIPTQATSLRYISTDLCCLCQNQAWERMNADSSVIICPFPITVTCLVPGFQFHKLQTLHFYY
jgi:hypothetical protein